MSSGTSSGMPSARAHVIRMSSAHLPQLPNFMQYYTWCHLNVVCTSSACRPETQMSSAGMYVIHMSSAGTYVIHTSSAEFLMVRVDHKYLSTVTGTGY